MFFRLTTLGCKVNQYETQYIRAALLANGHQEAGPNNSDQVELVIVNTCSVTAESDAKSRKAISHEAKRYPSAKIVVMGCFASGNPESAASLPRVDHIVTDKRKLDDFLLELGCSLLPQRIDSFDERHRAFVKIQDGCRVGCAYCIIPQTRPYLWSRPIPEILTEIDCLCNHGYRELVLTGIHLGHYGLNTEQEKNASLDKYLTLRANMSDTERIDLSRLLEHIATKNFSARFRLGSLEAVEVSKHMLDVMASDSQTFCPHFHVSMQSGDDTVLKRMRRRWSSGPFRDKCQEIAAHIPNSVLTTDVIVGFPGETDDQFETTCRMVEELAFAKVHVFRYSRRPGTIAADMPDQIPEPVKKERVAILQTISDRLHRNAMERFVGQKVQVLVEDIVRNAGRITCRGTTQHYLPAAFSTRDEGVACGSLVEITPDSIQEEHLMADDLF